MKIEIVFKDDKKCKHSSCEVNIHIEKDVLANSTHLAGYGTHVLDLTVYEQTYSQLLVKLTGVLGHGDLPEAFMEAINEYKFNELTLESLFISNVNKINDVSDNWYEKNQIETTQDADWNIHLASVLEKNNV